MNKLICILVLVGAATAQSVSPVITQCGKRCGGQLTVTNDGTIPMAAIVEPWSFSLNPATGRSMFRKLDSTVQVSLSETSARIGPKDSHTFDYDMKCASYPCLVTFRVGAIVGHTAEGLAIRVVLPSVVYQCQREKNCRANTRLAAGLKD